MRSAGCCFNDVADRDFDKHVKRTAQRPVTTGAIALRDAVLLGVLLAFAAFVLVLTTNASTIVWSFAALLVTLIYPLAKRAVSMPQAVLGIAFSFGIPMAFSAVHGASTWDIPSAWRSVDYSAWLLLLGNLFWVLAYDTEYAMVDRDDDIRIGMKTSAITLGRWDVPVVMACYVAYAAIWEMALWSRGLGWLFHLGVAAALAQAIWHWTLIRDRSREGCFRAFRANHWVGFAVFAGIVAAYQFMPAY